MQAGRQAGGQLVHSPWRYTMNSSKKCGLVDALFISSSMAVIVNVSC